MKITPKAARTILVMAALYGSSALAVTPKAVLAARASAVQILWAKDGKQNAICTGAVVQLPQGPRVVSAGHCALEPELVGGTFSALDLNGNVWPMRLESAGFTWPTTDFAVFNSAAEWVLPALKISPRMFEIGQDVYSWSGPAGINVMLFHGEITGQLHFPTDPEGEQAIGGMWYSANLLTAGGASGSSVLDSEGRVMALLVGGFQVTTKLNGAFFSTIPTADDMGLQP